MIIMPKSGPEDFLRGGIGRSESTEFDVLNEGGGVAGMAIL
jgi:hypothetical protein